MIYFDNAATSFPKAPGVSEAIARFVVGHAANPGRSGHRMAVAVEQLIDMTRLKLSRLFGVADHRRMIFTMNGTDALNIAIKGVLMGMDQVPHVITTVLEHNSVSRPLQAMAVRGQIDLTRVDCDDQGFIDPDQIRKAIKSSTVLIVMTHASNVLGTIQDIAAVGRIAREHDLLFCVDAAQSVGILKISVESMCIDLLAFPCHKALLGPTGTGGLYVGSRCPEPIESVEDRSEIDDAQNPTIGRLLPWREGGTGGDSATATQPTLYPHYLEGGTPNTVGISGLSAALDYVVQQSMQRRLNHERAMCQKLAERFASDKRFRLYGTGGNTHRLGVLSITIEGIDALDVGAILDDSFNMAVRSGLHCAPYIHRRLGTFPSGTVRISPGEFNTDQELDQLIQALDEVAG